LAVATGPAFEVKMEKNPITAPTNVIANVDTKLGLLTIIGRKVIASAKVKEKAVTAKIGRLTSLDSGSNAMKAPLRVPKRMHRTSKNCIIFSLDTLTTALS